MWEEYGFVGLFAVSFGAATILPVSSELVFASMTGAGFDPVICIWAATAGNWLGGMSSYFLGRLGKMEWIEKYLRVKREKIETYRERIQKYGDWFAFFSFLPGIGDIIAVASGFFRCRWWIVAISMLLGKFARYVVWMYANGFIMPA